MDNSEFLAQIKKNNEAWEKKNPQKRPGKIRSAAYIMWRVTLGNDVGKVAFIIVVGIISLYATKQNAEFDRGSSYSGDVPTEYLCVGQGIAYFKSIGSWPRLTNGRDAKLEAEDRCRRTTNAFRGLEEKS